MNHLDETVALSPGDSSMQNDTVVLPVVPGYTVHSVLGKGGFATVYLATQISLNRRVALKIMNPAYATDANLCERFDREGRDLATVSEHDSIVTVYNVGRHKNLYYIAMQYLPGPTLKQLINAEAPYQHPLYIISRIAEALAHAHAKGYVHRDIKPGNILFNEQGEAVLSDFGIAKTLNREEQLTMVGQVVGTEYYMSPEQALASDLLDRRSDIYSLGVVFYETLTRGLPYKPTESHSVRSQHINGPVPQLPESEAKYQPLINRMMAKNPDDRYLTADELLKDIRQHFIVQHAPRPPVGTWSVWQTIGAALSGLVIIILLASFFIPLDNERDNRSKLSAEDLSTIADYLELADLNELMGRISTPPGSNAIELYELVLELDPDNEEALSALARLRAR